MLLGAGEAVGQSDLRVLVGGLELTHQYGLLVAMPLGEGPFSLEGQAGPGGGGGSLNLSGRVLGPAGTRQGVMWFVSGGIGAYFTASSPGRLDGGAYTLVGGLRAVSAVGLALEAGLGGFQTLGARNPDGRRRGVAGRLAVGWQF